MKHDQKIILVNINDDNSYNEYYASVSVLFRIASFAFFIAFLVFIVYSAFGSQNVFNYDNFEYIVRNFALTLDEKRDEASYSIRYNPDSSSSFAMIGNKFALSGNSGISVYSSTGRLICSDFFSFKNPVMVSSDQYALVYDSGNHDFVIYNSFTKVYSQATDKPIIGCHMLTDGSFAVITSADGYNSTVELYNENFKLVNRFNKTGFVVDVDMSDESILISTVNNSVNYGKYQSQIQLYDFVNSETVYDITVDSSLPLACSITSAGFILVCSDETIFYDSVNEFYSTCSYNGYDIVNFACSGDFLALLLDAPGHDISYRLSIFDSSVQAHNFTINSLVYDMVISGDSCCLLTDSKILVFDSASQTELAVSGIGNDCSLLVRDEASLYLCTDSAAVIVDLKQ